MSINYPVPSMQVFAEDNTDGWQLLDAFQSNLAIGPVYTSPYQGNHCQSSRTYHKATFDTDRVALLVGNLTTGGTDTNGNVIQNPALCSIVYRICLQVANPANLDDQTPQRYPVTYQGSEQITIRPNEIIRTDPCPIPLTAGAVYYVWTAVESSCQGYNYTPIVQTSLGGTASGGMNNGEGAGSGDLTLVGTVTPAFAYQSLPGLVAVLGHSINQKKTAITFGTSIEDGTGDGGAAGQFWAGAMHRALAGIAVHTTKTANYLAASPQPFFRACVGGRNGDQTLTFLRSSPFWQAENYASTIIWGHCNNDTSTLTALKALALRAADMARKGNKKIIACTNVVQSGSTTDNWQTLANYTPGANGYAPQAYAAWLRDASPSGFVAQAGGLLWADYWDGCVGEECNGLGLPVLAGGYRCPPSNPAIWTGVVTNAFTPWIYDDTTPGNLPSIQDALLGYQVIFDTGAAAGQKFGVGQNLPYLVQAPGGNMVSPTIPAWVGGTAYTLKTVRQNGGKYYTCSQAGNAAAVGGPTTDGIVDGTCSWEYIAPTVAWSAGLTPTVGQFVVAAGARLYYCTKVVGPTGGVAPTSTTITTPITDGGVTWEYFGVVVGAHPGNSQAITQNGGNLALAYKYWTNAGNVYRLWSSGTTGVGTAPTGTGIVDGTCTWNQLQCGAAGVQRGDTYHIGTYTSLDGSHLGTEGYMQGANAFLNNPWQAGAAYQISMAVVSNGNIYRCVATGQPNNGFTNAVTAPSGTSYGVNYPDAGNPSLVWRLWTPVLGSLPWFGGWTYVLGNVIQANGNCYRCVQTGVAATPSHGPSGTGLGIVDGAAKWDWLNAGNIPTWIPNGVYIQGQIVSNGGNLYFCQTAGAGAVAGGGPTGTGTAIADNAAVWSYYTPWPLTNNLLPWLNKIA